jgi:hypothetical protein
MVARPRELLGGQPLSQFGIDIQEANEVSDHDSGRVPFLTIP